MVGIPATPPSEILVFILDFSFRFERICLHFFQKKNAPGIAENLLFPRAHRLPRAADTPALRHHPVMECDVAAAKSEPQRLRVFLPAIT
jgi:hypothetical protein